MKHDSVVHSSPDLYSSFPGLLRSSNTILVSYTNQRLDKLRAIGVHAHYQPVAELWYAQSDDGGRSWSRTRTPPNIVPIEHATRGGHGVCHALDDGSVLVLVKGYEPGSTTPAALMGYVYEGSAPVGEPFEITEVGPFEMFYPFDVARLEDGSLLLAGNHGGSSEDDDGTRVWESTGVNPNTVVFLRGTPDGREWSYLSQAPNGNRFDFTESSILDTGDGRVVCTMRTDWVGSPMDELPAEVNGNGTKRDGYGYFIYQSESLDHGATWSEPVQLPMWGHPPYCLKLQSGNVLMVYGHRRPPLEVRAVLSTDACRTWDISTLTTLHRFDTGGDMGYPVCTQLPGGEIFCTYYGHSTDDISEPTPRAIFGTLFSEDDLIR